MAKSKHSKRKSIVAQPAQSGEAAVVKRVSTKPTHTNDSNLFNRLSMIVISGLLIAVLFLAAANTGTSLHVRSIELSGTSAAADIQRQKLVIHFNRPLQKDSITNAVGISPTTRHVVSWQGNDMVVAFTDNLQYDTDYQLLLTTDAKDVYGENLTAGFSYKFHTKSAKLFYREVDSSGTQVRIMSVGPDLTNPQVVYQADGITSFTVNKQYLGVALTVANQPNSTLVLKDLKTSSERTIDFPNLRINKLAFSPTRNELAIIVQNYTKIGNSLIPDLGSKIRLYDLTTLNYREINPQNVANEVIDIIFAPNGQNLLIKINDSNFYIADLNKPDEVVILGKHLYSAGFNPAGDRILFIDFDPLNTYTAIPYLSMLDADKNATQLSANNSYVIDPQFFNNTDEIIFAEKHSDVEGTRGLYKLRLANFSGKSLDLYTDITRSLELPRLSYDDRYVAVERYETLDIMDYTHQRDFQFQTKPNRAQIIVIDLLTGMIVDKDINGIDAVWLP